jgi:hypothetical protein
VDRERLQRLRAGAQQAGVLVERLQQPDPCSCVEYLDLIGPLTDPRVHGGDPADAFHVVVPDLPGFAFSGPTREPGWNQYRTAAAWVELMRRLGYGRYGAHGNDGGSMVSPEVGRLDPVHVVGCTSPSCSPSPPGTRPSSRA